MRNTELEKLDGLVGEWRTTISDAWFLEPPGTEVPRGLRALASNAAVSRSNGYTNGAGKRPND